MGRLKRRQGRTAARATAGSGPRARVSSRSLEPFRRALAAARQASGLTQAGLAARLGTTQSAIARLERGEVAPSITTLSRLADALGIQFEVAPRSGIIIRNTLATLSLSSLRARRNELLAIAARHGARNVRVFGSVARGDARPDSDVDFMVKFELGRTVLDLSDLILDLEDTLGRKVDVVEVRRPSRAAEGIRHEAVPL